MTAPKWPEITVRLHRDGLIVVIGDDPDEPERVVDLFAQRKVAVVATTSIGGRKAVAQQLVEGEVYDDLGEDRLIAICTFDLRMELWRLASESHAFEVS